MTLNDFLLMLRNKGVYLKKSINYENYLLKVDYSFLKFNDVKEIREKLLHNHNITISEHKDSIINIVFYVNQD